MRVIPPALELPAAIKKAQIAHFGAAVGLINEKTFHGHAPKTLRYRTFAGALNLDTNLYAGVHLFDVNTADGETADFTKLFGGK